MPTELPHAVTAIPGRTVRQGRVRPGIIGDPWRGPAIWALVCLLAFLGSNGAAAARPASADPAAVDVGAVEVKAESLLGGTFRPGGVVPIRVVVSSDTEFTGTVRATVGPDFSGGSGSDEATVVVGAAGRGEGVLLVPFPAADSAGVVVAGDQQRLSLSASVLVTVEDATGEAVASETLNFSYAGETLVWLLPGAVPADGPPQALRVPPVDSPFEFFGIDPAALPAPVMPGVDTAVSSVAELGGLGDGWLWAIGDFVRHGGTLVVDDPPGTTLPRGLGELTAQSAKGTTTPPAAVVVGDGMVVFATGGVGRGEWADLIGPGGRPETGSPLDVFLGSGVNEALASLSGIRILDVRTLGAGVTGYVLLVGPVLFLVLGRLRRRDLAWRLIPAIAIVGLGAVWLLGSMLRADARPSLVGVHEAPWAPDSTFGSGRALSLVGAPTGGRDTATVAFPAGWSRQRDREVGDASMVRFRTGSDTTVGRSTPGRNSLGVVGAIGRPGEGGSTALSESAPHGLDVRVRTVDAGTGAAEGTVVNRSTDRLTRVVVLAPFGLAVAVGDLDPGQERQWTLVPGVDAQASSVLTATWDVPDNGLMIPARSANRARVRSVSRPAGVWSLYATSSLGAVEPGSRFLAAGWSTRAAGKVGSIDGAAPRTASILVVARSDRWPDLGGVGPGRRVPMRVVTVDPTTNMSTYRVDVGTPGPGGAVLVSVSLPTPVEYWNGTDWAQLTAGERVGSTAPVAILPNPGTGQDPPPASDVMAIPLPADGVRFGRVLVRVANRGSWESPLYAWVAAS